MTRLQQIASRRQQLLTADLIDRVTAIREATVANLPELTTKLQETLTGKLATVYSAKDQNEAAKILTGLLQGQQQIARAYSNTLAEINFDAMMAAQGTKIHLTRLEEIVQAQRKLPDSGHPHFPTLTVNQEEIVQSLQEFSQLSQADAPELRQAAAAKIKDNILQCEYGVTGVNSLVAENGVMILAEEEGNVRAVSNLPYRHVAVVGLDKMNWSAEDCMAVLQATAICGAGRRTPTYFSLIAGPSRTADIEFRMAYGMHGPKEVHIILLDNGRLALRDQGAGAALKCINCGSCYESCATLAQQQDWRNVVLSPKGLALGIVQGRISPVKGKETMPDFTCPVGLSPAIVLRTLGEVRPV